MLSDTEIRKTKPTGKDQWLSDAGGRGKGRLTLRITPTGQRIFYFRSTNDQGKRELIRLGVYGTDLTLADARTQAAELSIRRQRGESSVKDALAHEQQQQDQERKRIRIEQEAAEARAKAGSLQTLMDLYVAHLDAQKKVSAPDVKGAFKNHVTLAFPALAESQAAAVTSQELREVLTRLIEAGKGRAAAKLRAHLRAAYSLAMRAEFDPTAPAGFLALHVDNNPLERLPSLSQFNRARDRALSWPELRAYQAHLEAMPDGGIRDLLLLSLYLGGQRPTQAARLTEQDIDLHGKTITIHDPKGRRAQPRPHTLPLSTRAIEIIHRRLADVEIGWIFSTRHGRTQIDTSSLSSTVTAISKAMIEAGTARAPFHMGDIRRTAETLLAGMGISKDLRAQIQSHGLGGIQARHYDRHSYMDEKRRALEAWETKLFEAETACNVVAITRAA